MGVTFFMLVYGAEAIFPMKIELPALRLPALRFATVANANPSEEGYTHEQIAVLERLDEYRNDVSKRLQWYRE